MSTLIIKIFSLRSFASRIRYVFFAAMICLAAGAAYFYQSHTAAPEHKTPATPRAGSNTQNSTPQDTRIVSLPDASTSLIANIVPPHTNPSHAVKNTPAPRTRATARTALTQSSNVNQDEQLDKLLHDAYQAYQAGDLMSAQQSYRAALTLEANNLDALLGQAATAQRLSADTQAAEYYKKVLVLDPRNAVANAGMSALHADEDQESRLKLLLLEQPRSASLHFALGNHYAARSRWREAQRAYFDAYQNAPDNAGIAFNLAISLEYLGQNKMAARFYRRALQLDPENSAGLNHANLEQHAKHLAE